MILNAITGLAADTSTTGADLLAVTMAGLAVMIIVGIAAYIYMAITLMTTARRLRTEPAWLAWIPVANLYLQAKMARKSAWPLWLLLSWVLLLLGFISPILLVIGIVIAVICSLIAGVFSYIWQWKICEARGKPGWWAILPLAGTVLGAVLNFIPYSLISSIGTLFSLASLVWTFVMWGILAWGK